VGSFLCTLLCVIYLFDIRHFFSIFQCWVADTVDTADLADTAFRKRRIRRRKGEGPGSKGEWAIQVRYNKI
jgi:hypothetical protein